MDESYHDTPEQSTKMCSQCHKEKPFEAFNKATGSKSGYRSACKICSAERIKHPLIVQQPLFIISRACKGCHKEKLLEEFDVHNRSKRDGRRAWCKECRHAESKRTYQPLKKPLPPVAQNGKICRQCLKEKPLDQFYRDKRASDLLGTQCKECKHYTEYVVNGEKTHERTRRNWKINKDRYNETHRKWLTLNEFAVREIARRRECKMREVTIENVSYKYILERDGYFCYICEQVIHPHQKFEFDHVVPISRGGMHAEKNIKMSHKTCNRRKKDRFVDELTPYHRSGPDA